MAVLSVGKPNAQIVDKLPTVGFEAVHAHVQQVLPLFHPPGARFLRGEIRYMCADKPLFGDLVRRAVGVFNHHSLRHGIGVVRTVLGADLARLKLFQSGNLPKHQPQPLLVQRIDQRLWIGPRLVILEVFGGKRFVAALLRIRRTVPDIERRLIAPGFQHHHGCGIGVFPEKPELFLRIGLLIPAVGRYPRPEGPFGRQRWLACHFDKRRDHVPRCAVQEVYVTVLCRDTDLHPSGRQNEHDGITGVHKNAVAVVAEEERQREICQFTLLCELFDHGTFGTLLHAVNAVKAFPHAKGRRCIAVISDNGFGARCILREISLALWVPVMKMDHISPLRRLTSGRF